MLKTTNVCSIGSERWIIAIVPCISSKLRDLIELPKSEGILLRIVSFALKLPALIVWLKPLELSATSFTIKRAIVLLLSWLSFMCHRSLQLMPVEWAVLCEHVKWNELWLCWNVVAFYFFSMCDWDNSRATSLIVLFYSQLIWIFMCWHNINTILTRIRCTMHSKMDYLNLLLWIERKL